MYVVYIELVPRVQMQIIQIPKVIIPMINDFLSVQVIDEYPVMLGLKHLISV